MNIKRKIQDNLNQKLLNAARKRDFKTVLNYLMNGADPFVQDLNGKTVIDYVAMYKKNV